MKPVAWKSSLLDELGRPEPRAIVFNRTRSDQVSCGDFSDRAIQALHGVVGRWRTRIGAPTGRVAALSPGQPQSIIAPLRARDKARVTGAAGKLWRWLLEHIGIKTRAFRRLVVAARAGNADAQYHLGQAYLHGQNAPRYPLVAVRWLSEAAAREHVAACHVLSLIYSSGIKTASVAFASEDHGSCHVVPLYPQGFDVKPDPERAFGFAKIAAQRGLAAAQGNLGLMYLRGIGCAQDYRKAARWARFAAVQHDANGALALGLLHEHGLGMPVNLTEAARWYAVASEQGNDTAATALGLLLLDGRGVSQDIEQAQQLLAGPAARGDDVAKQGLARSRSRRRIRG